MNANADSLYEKYLNLSHDEKSILKSASNDSSIINSVKIVRLYLDAEATQPVISAFLKRLRESGSF